MPQAEVVCSASELERGFLENLTRILPERKAVPAMVLAVSGGADSTALACLVHRTLTDCVHPIVIAHFHHHLRGAEADEDERFVFKLATDLGLEYRRGDWNPITRDRNPRPDRNLQAAARKARYAFLGEVAQDLSPDAVVLTAHQRRDQVESVLQNLARGGGEGALIGIREKALRGSVWVLRPLLRFSPDRLRAYLEQLGIRHRKDSSNQDPKYRRNWLRKELLPKIGEADPLFEKNLASRSLSYQDQLERWKKLAEKIYRAGLSRKGTLILARKELAEIPEEGRFLCVREILRSLSVGQSVPGETWAPTRRKPLQRFLDLVSSGQDGTIPLPGGIHAVFSGKTVTLRCPKEVGGS